MDSAFQLFLKEFAEFRKEIRENLSQITQRLGSIEGHLDSMEDTVRPLVVAFDKDSEILLNHGQRISRMEKHLRR